jgi:hypothetical protein
MKARARFVALMTIGLFPSALSVQNYLDNELVHLSIRCMELAYQVQLHEANTVENSYFYQDGPHAAMFVQQDNYCFLVFDSTHSGEDGLADWYVNFDPSNTDICAPDGTCCRTRSGFKRAYDTSYRQVLDQQVRDCYSDGANKVVVVGHSQGGGIAPVGAVALADTDPTLVLFGAPGSINDDCPPLSREKYHRWLNTYVGSDGKVSHDPVANLNWRSEQYGHMYLMGNDPNNIVHYSHGEYPIYTKFAPQAHQLLLYTNKFAAFETTRNAGISIGMDGWAVGYPCNQDSECIDSCIDGKCQEVGAVGSWCNGDGDCLSGRCEGNIRFIQAGTCQDRLMQGQPCNEASDCVSNSCPFAVFRRICS